VLMAIAGSRFLVFTTMCLPRLNGLDGNMNNGSGSSVSDFEGEARWYYEDRGYARLGMNECWPYTGVHPSQDRPANRANYNMDCLIPVFLWISHATMTTCPLTRHDYSETAKYDWWLIAKLCGPVEDARAVILLPRASRQLQCVTSAHLLSQGVSAS
jgi:hypothetical protein